MARHLICFSAPDTQTYIHPVLLKRVFQTNSSTVLLKRIWAKTRDNLAAAPRCLLKLDELPDAFTR